MRGVLFLLVMFAASAAPAQYDDDEELPQLKGTSRISVMGGWRYGPNAKFYDNYYFRSENLHLTRAGGSPGGPYASGTFAYSVSEFVEVGIDLFTTYERMSLTNKPGLNAVTYGALIGLRFQKQFELQNKRRLVPSLGLLIGPHIAASYFDGGHAVERSSTAIGLSAGATLHLTAPWGVSVEFRQIIAHGDAEDIGEYNAGGSTLLVGVTYILPWEWNSREIPGHLR